MTTIILSSLLFLTFSMYIYSMYKYNVLKGKIKELNKPLRHGYYRLNCTQGTTKKWEPTVFVNELDRYTNGESRISMSRIEIKVDDGDGQFNFKTANEFVIRKFESIVKTSDITWLESEQSIKDIRRNKLEQIQKIAK